jgi:hypothetical protein
MFLPALFHIDPKGGIMQHWLGYSSPDEFRRTVTEGLTSRIIFEQEKSAMKKFARLTLSLLVVGLLVLTTLAGMAAAQDRGETKATIGNANVSIEYGRAFLKGRDPLKMMEPGKVWRIGSNAPTTITSDVDLDFGGTRIAKGKNILLARLAEPGKWSLLVSTKNVFQYEPSAKLAEVPIEVKQDKESVEQLTITLTNKDGRGVIEIAWETSRLLASFGVAK